MTVDPEIYPLTGLRFVAAFYVFLFHIHIRWPLTHQPFVRNILDEGAVGMSLFFVLSGFVLAYRYADGRTPLRDYLINRFARIYPVYVVAALVTLPWIGVEFVGGPPAEMWASLARLAALVFANVFLIQAWFLQFFSYWNDGASWSIAVEAFFYMILPFVLPAFAHFSMRRLIAVLAVCWVLASLPGLVAALFETPANGVFYSMPIFRLPEFLIGMGTFLLIRQGVSLTRSTALQAGVIVGTLVYLGVVGDALPLYVGHNWIVVPAIAFTIFSLANNTGPIAALLSTRAFVWLGKISYCFYSFQVLILYLLLGNHDRLVAAVPVLGNNKVLLVAAFVVLIGLSALGHHFIEEPARRWIRRFDIGERQPSAA